MNYELLGMGTAREDAQRAYAEGQRLFEAGQYSRAYDQFANANRLSPAPAALQSMAASAARAGRCAQALTHFRAYISSGEILNSASRELFYSCLDREGQQPPSGGAAASSGSSGRTGTPALPDLDLRPLPPELEPGGSSPTATSSAGASGPAVVGAGVDVTGEAGAGVGKRTWWPSDPSSMFDTIAQKVGLSAGREAQNVAREVQGEAGAGAETQYRPPGLQRQEAPTVNTGEGSSLASLAPWIVGGVLGVGVLGLIIVLIVRSTRGDD